jgi:hypothetical protein
MEAATAYLLAMLTGGNAPVFPLYYTSASTTLINSATDIPVSGLAAPVTAGVTYGISALVAYVTGGGGANPVFSFHAPAVTAVAVETYYLDSTAGTAGSAKVLNGSFASSTGPTMTATDTCAYRASGLVTFSASGTLSLQAHTTVGADTFTCQVGAFIALTALQA